MNGLPSVNPHLIAVMEINSIPLTLPGDSRDTRAWVQGGEGRVPSRRPLRVCGVITAKPRIPRIFGSASSLGRLLGYKFDLKRRCQKRIQREPAAMQSTGEVTGFVQVCRGEGTGIWQGTGVSQPHQGHSTLLHSSSSPQGGSCCSATCRDHTVISMKPPACYSPRLQQPRICIPNDRHLGPDWPPPSLHPARSWGHRSTQGTSEPRGAAALPFQLPSHVVDRELLLTSSSCSQ